VSPVVRIVLTIAYAILCLAATGRSVFQITTKFADAPVPYTISAVSAVLYGVIAFALWTRRMGLALAGTVVELAGVIIVGTLGWLEPSWWADETVWTGYGSAYGWVPLALPVIALWLLLRERRSSTTT
jgi:hypothetical protein